MSHCALCVLVLAHIVAAIIIAWLLLKGRKGIADLPTPPADSSPDETGKVVLFIKGTAYAVTIIFKFGVLSYGGERLLRLGLSSLGSLLSPGWGQWRQIPENGPIPTYWTWLGYAVLPFAIALAGPALAGEAIFCTPERNINNYIPVRTRDDIKAILEAWYNTTKTLFQVGMSVQQMHKWPLSFGCFAVFATSASMAAVTELEIGLCRYNRLLWDIWFPILCTCAGAWFIDNAKELFGARAADGLSSAHAKLLLFLVVLYILRWSPVDEFCTKSGCW